MGFSDAPGAFLGGGLLALLVAYLSYQALGGTVGGVLALVFGIFGVAALLLIPNAIADATAYGPPTCPKCTAVCPVYPWSL